MLRVLKSGLFVLALSAASCSSDSAVDETSVTEEQAEIENALEFTVDVEASGTVEFGADGATVVTGSVRAPDERGVSLRG